MTTTIEPVAPAMAVRRRCGHWEQVPLTTDEWVLWAYRHQRCRACAAAWLDRPRCEGRCSTGPLGPSNDAPAAWR